MKSYFNEKMVETYGKHNVLTNIKTKNGKTITVDYLMGPILSILNLKGYYTEYSCSGHYDLLYGGIQIYILFKAKLNKDILPKKYVYGDNFRLIEPDIFNRLWEENKRMTAIGTPILLHKDYISFLHKNKLNSKKSRIRYIVKYLNILYNWANELPNKEEK